MFQLVTTEGKPSFPIINQPSPISNRKLQKLAEKNPTQLGKHGLSIVISIPIFTENIL